MYTDLPVNGYEWNQDDLEEVGSDVIWVNVTKFILRYGGTQGRTLARLLCVRAEIWARDIPITGEEF